MRELTQLLLAQRSPDNGMAVSSDMDESFMKEPQTAYLFAEWRQESGHQIDVSSSQAFCEFGA
jgi:hypothetical protein